MGRAAPFERPSRGFTASKFSFAFRSLMAAHAPLPGARKTPIFATLDRSLYPPDARIVTELSLVEEERMPEESAHTNDPVWLARASVPAAKARLVAALPSPPTIIA